MSQGDPIRFYQSGPRPSYQCSECLGWFTGGHFCVGRRSGTSAREIFDIMQSAIINREEPKPPDDPMVMIRLSEYLDLKAKAAPKAGARKGKG